MNNVRDEGPRADLPGPSAHIWRLVQVVSGIGTLVGFVVLFAAAAVGFVGPAEAHDAAHVTGAVGGVAAIGMTALFGVATTIYFPRLVRELIHGWADRAEDPAKTDAPPPRLTGRPLDPGELLPLGSASPVGTPTAERQSGRPSRSWLWVLLVAALGGVLMTRLVVVAVNSGDGGSSAGALGILIGGTLFAAGAPSGILLALGAARNRRLRRLAPHAFLIGSIRTPPLEFGLSRLFPSSVDHIRSYLVWAFDERGATLWQGAPVPRIVATIPRTSIVGIGFQEVAEMVGSFARDRLVIVTRSSEGDDVVVPFVVRLLNSPWTLRSGELLETTRSSILAAIGRTEDGHG